MKCSISITRNSAGEIHIRIRDEASRIEFVDMQMTPHDFAVAITGLSDVKGDMSVRGLAFVGMEKVMEDRRIRCPLDTYSREELEKWLAENGKEDGWIVAPYLGSQNSVARSASGTYLNYRVYKFVEPQS